MGFCPSFTKAEKNPDISETLILNDLNIYKYINVYRYTLSTCRMSKIVTFYFILNIVMHLMFYHQIWDEYFCVFVFLWDLFSRNWLENGCSWFDIVKKNTYAIKWSFKLIPQVSNFFKFHFTHVKSRPTVFFFFFCYFDVLSCLSHCITLH